MKREIVGASPDAPIVENENGGMQSKVGYAFHLLDANALLAVAQVFAEGAEKYARDNWRLISCEEHINHAIGHLVLALAGDRQDDHLAHAIARTMMAYATQADGSLEARREFIGQPHICNNCGVMFDSHQRDNCPSCKALL